MANSARFEQVLALGHRLVEELRLERSGDTLGRWIAHHIADLISTAEATEKKERELAQDRCFKAILELWKHRADLPNGQRPFETMEPIARAIKSLDPDDPTPRYFNLGRTVKNEGEEKSDSDKWLEAAISLDFSAKVLIGYCLWQAAQAALDKSEEWVNLAEAAGVEDEAFALIIRFTSDNVQKSTDPDAETRKRLQDRLRKLQSFSERTEILVRHLQTQLQSLGPAPPTEDIEPREDPESMRVNLATHTPQHRT